MCCLFWHCYWDISLESDWPQHIYQHDKRFERGFLTFIAMMALLSWLRCQQILLTSSANKVEACMMGLKAKHVLSVKKFIPSAKTSLVQHMNEKQQQKNLILYWEINCEICCVKFSKNSVKCNEDHAAAHSLKMMLHMQFLCELHLSSCEHGASGDPDIWLAGEAVLNKRYRLTCHFTNQPRHANLCFFLTIRGIDLATILYIKAFLAPEATLHTELYNRVLTNLRVCYKTIVCWRSFIRECICQ